MKQIKALAVQSAALNAQYSALNEDYSKLRSELSAKDIESYEEEQRQMETLHQRQEKAIAKTKKEMESTIRENEQLRAVVQAYLNKYTHFAPDVIKTHKPRPEEMNREAVEALCKKIDKNDLLSLFKRKLQIGGYGTKEDMARELLCKLMDADAYCEKEIRGAKRQQEIEQLRVESKYIKQISDQMVAWSEYHKKFDKNMKIKLASSQKKIQDFLSSGELLDFTRKVQQLQAQALADTPWDSYIRPVGMPEKIRLVNIRQSLVSGIPDPKTSGPVLQLQPATLPVNLELYRNHILVFTADPINAPGSDSIARLVAHRFLARLLKELPPQSCHCVLADLEGRGFNLSPLNPIAEIAGLSWTMITRPQQAGADRKTFLDFQNTVAQDIVISGKTFFEAAQTENERRYPFSWYADFSFPGDLGSDLRADLAAMMQTASLAGTSFLFVTTEQGLRQIRQMAQPYGDMDLIHIDCAAKCLRLGSDSYSFVLDQEPDNTQIREFVRTIRIH